MPSNTTPRPLPSTPQTLSPLSDSDDKLSLNLAPSVVSRLHFITPPPSPTPFMKDFTATAQPPPTAVQAICSTSAPSRFWRVANIPRIHVLVALATAILLLLFTAGPVAILFNLLHIRVQHEESFDYGPMRTAYPTHLPNVVPYLHPRHERIAKRQQSSSNLNLKTSSTPTPTSSSSTTTSLATAPPIPTDRPPLPTPFPQPFDDTLSGVDFISASCQQFFTAFTNDINFRSCRAFSFLFATSEQFLDMLGPDSTGFGNVTDPLAAVTDVLWGICNTSTDEASCALRMVDYEKQMQTACKNELSQEQPLAVTALHGAYNHRSLLTHTLLRRER